MVVMDATHYAQLAWQRLRDLKAYERLDRYPTEEMVKTFNNCLEQRLTDGIIADEVVGSVRLPSSTEIQTIYFVPKTHKTLCRLGPESPLQMDPRVEPQPTWTGYYNP